MLKSKSISQKYIKIFFYVQVCRHGSQGQEGGGGYTEADDGQHGNTWCAAETDGCIGGQETGAEAAHRGGG